FGTRRLPGLQNYLQSRTTGLSPEPRLGTLPFGDAASQVWPSAATVASLPVNARNRGRRLPEPRALVAHTITSGAPNDTLMPQPHRCTRSAARVSLLRKAAPLAFVARSQPPALA